MGLRYFPRRFFLRLTFFHMLLGMAAIIAATLIGRFYLRSFFQQQLNLSAEENLRELKSIFQHYHVSPLQWCEQASSRHFLYRFTLMTNQGEVVCDTHEDFRHMENHLHRPEVQQAILSGHGQDTRWGVTLHQNMLYMAIPIEWTGPHKENIKGVFRQALPLDQIHQAFRQVDRSIFMGILPVFLLVSLLIFYRSHQFAKTIGQLIAKTSEWEEKQNRSLSLGEDELAILDQAIGRQRGHFSILLNSLTEPVVGFDKDLKFLFCNTAFKNFFRVKSHQSLPDIFPQPEMLHPFRSVLEKGSTLGPMEIGATAYGGAGPQTYFYLIISPLMGGQSAATQGAVAIFYDMTKNKLLEQMRTDFVANISHEVRTPLASIMGAIDLVRWEMKNALINDKARTSMQGPLDILARNSQRLLSLFQDLLTLSLLESNSALEEEEEIDLTEFLLEITQSYTETRSQQLTLEYHLQPLSLWAPRSSLETVVTNLVENAYKYVPSPGKLIICTQSTAEGTLISFTDNGPGIGPEHLPRIFERFYRVDQGRSQEIQGTGLGLSIVKHVVMKMGGKIWVESSPGKGTSFYVLLPPRGNAANDNRPIPPIHESIHPRL